MTDGLLLVIAVSTGLAAIVQITVLVFALRAAKQLGEAVQRIERELQPVFSNLRSASIDVARVTAVAADQMERADRALSDLSRSVDHAASSLYSSLIKPLSNGAAVLAGLRTVFEMLRDLRRPRRPKPRPADGGDDEMFIG